MSEQINKNAILKQDDEIQIAQQLANYLDGKLSDNEQTLFEQAVAEKPLWQARFHAAQVLKNQAKLNIEQDVPQWNRTATFSSSHYTSSENSWWQWQGLPIMALAFSCVAIVLVVLKVDIKINEQGLLVSFANSSKALKLSDEKINVLVSKQVNEKVDQKLREFASEQQVILANFNADVRVKQQENNLQLASYLMATARKERKEDIGDFISYVNEQNQVDSVQQKLEMQQLRFAIENQSSKSISNLQPANYKLED